MKKIGFIFALLVLAVGLAFTINSIVKGLYVEMAIFATLASMAFYPLLILLLINRQKKKGTLPRPISTLNPPLLDDVIIISPGIDKFTRSNLKYIPLLALVTLVVSLGMVYWSVTMQAAGSTIFLSFMLGIALDSIILLSYKKLKNKQEPMAEALQQ
jgi:TRAP-type uncharacterized transport system fused permease subunit